MKRKVVAVLLCLCFAFLSFGCVNAEYKEHLSYPFGDQNLYLSVFLIGDKQEHAWAEMIDVMEELNLDININDQNLDTNILRLNRAKAGETVEIGRHSYYLLNAAKEIYNDTDGLFNVAAYPLTYLWGVDAVSIPSDNFEQVEPPSFINSAISAQYKPTKAQIETVKAYCDLDKLEVCEDKTENKYYAKKNIDELMVDLGAIAKGYAADLCAEICEKYQIESASINFSGNLYCYGKYYDGEITKKWKDEWILGVKKPVYGAGESICKFKTGINTTAVTSGDYQRFRVWVNDQNDLSSKYNACHIINPASGIPYSLKAEDEDYFNTDNHITSCTVISNNSMYADSYTTAVCVMGLEKGVKFLRDISIEKPELGLKAIIFTKDKQYALVNGVELTETKQYKGYQEYAPYNPV